MSNEAVYRTAPATPGLLTIIGINKTIFDMFLYLKLAGGFEQKSSRLIEAHVRIASVMQYRF